MPEEKKRLVRKKLLNYDMIIEYSNIKLDNNIEKEASNQS